MADKSLIPAEMIERKIYLVRGHKVMLDSDLAQLYKVETRTLIQAVKRNINRFPADFMFQLSDETVVASLPILFRTLRGQKISEKKLEKLVELIKKA